MSECVCVCHPLCQRVQCHCFPLQPLNEAGASGSTHLPDATKLWCVEGSSQRRLTVYLPNCSQAVTPIFLFFASMVVHDTSHKQVFPRPPLSCRPPFVRCCRESADAHKPFVENTYNLIGLFTLPLSHSFSREIELTENQCQSVFRSAVPLGC